MSRGSLATAKSAWTSTYMGTWMRSTYTLLHKVKSQSWECVFANAETTEIIEIQQL